MRVRRPASLPVPFFLLALFLSCGGPDRHLGMQLQGQSDRLRDDCPRGASVGDCPGHRTHLECMLGKVELLPRETPDEVRFFVTQCRDTRYSVNEYNQTCGEPHVVLPAALDDVCGQHGG